jgi:hypothetical protein
MKIPQLDKVAIWQPIGTDKLDVRKYNQYRYIDKGLLQDSTKPVYRYAQNFKLGDFAYSLIVVTHETSTEAVEKLFNRTAKNLSDDDKKHVTHGASIIKYAEVDNA